MRRKEGAVRKYGIRPKELTFYFLLSPKIKIKKLSNKKTKKIYIEKGRKQA